MGDDGTVAGAFGAFDFCVVMGFLMIIPMGWCAWSNYKGTLDFGLILTI